MKRIYNNADGDGLRLVAVGDISFNGRWHEELAAHGPGFPNKFVIDRWKQADLKIANLESPVTNCPRFSPSKLVLRGSSETFGVLQNDEFGAITLANNHMMDFGVEGLMETRERAAEAGISCHGAGQNEAEATRPLILEKKGVLIGFLSFCDVVQESPLYARQNQGGVAYFDRENARRLVSQLRKEVDLVVVQLHWGREYCRLPSGDQRRAARELVAAGADIILGHHPHVVQPFEVIDGKPVFYSLGNWLFSDDYWKGVNRRGQEFVARYNLIECTSRGAWAEIVIKQNQIQSWLHVVERNSRLQPVPAPEARQERLLTDANDQNYELRYCREEQLAQGRAGEVEDKTTWEKVRLRLARYRIFPLPFEAK